MKRYGNLYPILISDDNLITAIETVNKTHRWIRHHRPNKTVAWVERSMNERVEELRQIIINGYEPSPARQRTIYDKSSNKHREIYEPKLWPDQYIHHALIQVIQQPIMRGMDYWCCGSIPGRGTAHGIRGIKHWMEHDIRGTKYCAELDIHHFYHNLTPDIVMAQMKRIIKDKYVLDLIERILHDGVPIGNYCSQWFANAVLQPLDHMIREKLDIDHYVRYMDNFTLFCASKKRLHAAVHEIDIWLRQHGLRLKDNWQVFPSKSRMPNAMGYRYNQSYTLARKRTVLRLRRSCRRVEKRIKRGLEPAPEQAAGILSRAGWLKHCNGFRIEKTCLAAIGERRLKRVIRNAAKKHNRIQCGKLTGRYTDAKIDTRTLSAMNIDNTPASKTI